MNLLSYFYQFPVPQHGSVMPAVRGEIERVGKGTARCQMTEPDFFILHITVGQKLDVSIASSAIGAQSSS